VTFHEFGTFIANIYVLPFQIDFFFNRDARLGSGLLKYEIFRSKSQSVRLYNNLKKSVITNKYDVFRQPAARRCKNGCIFEILVTIVSSSGIYIYDK